jgi:predicted permease
MRMGYDADRVLLVNRVVRGTFPTEAEHRAVRDALVSTAQSLAGVEAAAWVSSAPFVSTSNNTIFVEGIDSVARLGTFTYQATTPDYFRVMGTRIVRGRALTADDRAGAQNAAVVSESMARVLWPQQDALGKCFRIRSDTVPCTVVVGVAEDMVQRDLAGAQRYHYYVPLEQYTRTWGNGLLVRTKGDPALEAERVRQALQRVIPGTSYVTVRPLRDIVQTAQASWRLGATMFVAFAALALIVAGVGLYGVIGYSVAQRMHELGVRVALGAQQRDILWLVVGQSIRFALAGITLGLVVALLQSRWIQPLLFHQSATDPWVLSAVTGTMLAVALVAAAAPAWRAAKADPNSALRAE